MHGLLDPNNSSYTTNHSRVWMFVTSSCVTSSCVTKRCVSKRFKLFLCMFIFILWLLYLEIGLILFLFVQISFQASKKREREPSDPFIDAISAFGKNMIETVAKKKSNTGEVTNLKRATTWQYIESLYESIPDKRIVALERKYVSMVMQAAQEEEEKNN